MGKQLELTTCQNAFQEAMNVYNTFMANAPEAVDPMAADWAVKALDPHTPLRGATPAEQDSIRAVLSEMLPAKEVNHVVKGAAEPETAPQIVYCNMSQDAAGNMVSNKQL